MRMLPKSVFLILLLPSVSNADMFGISDSQMYIQLLELVNTTKKQLENVKKTYEVSSEIYQLSQAESMSLDRILNTELVGMMRQRGWMLDGLDTLADISDIERQIGYLNKLIKDAEAAEDYEAAQQLQYAIDLLKQQKAIMQLASEADRNIAHSATDLSERESGRITAENTAILARQALAEQNRRNQEEAVEKAGLVEEKRVRRDAAKLLQNLGDR